MMADFDDNSMAAAAAAFGKLDEPVEPNVDDQSATADDDGNDAAVDDDGDPADTSAEAGDEPEDSDEREEPAAPAIDPPARWTEDQRKIWSALPADAQHVIAASFRDQERAIGVKSEEAASARKASDAAINEAASFARRYAEEMAGYARAFEPQRPDVALIATDPQAYSQQAALYEAQMAQRNDFAQRSAQAAQRAEAIEQQQHQAAAREFHDSLSQVWGEKWTDPKQREATIAELTSVADWLGYPKEIQAEASATDMLGLRKVADLKAKADKWDQLQASKMQLVRNAKQKPKTQTPGVAQPKGSERQRGFTDSMNRLRQSGDVRDAAAAFAKLG